MKTDKAHKARVIVRGVRVATGYREPATTWNSIRQLLVGLGEHPASLDGSRIHLRVAIRECLGAHLDRPWMISFWSEHCLRALPANLWRQYLEHIRKGLHSPDTD